MTGTNHPYMTLKLLTDGKTNSKTGNFYVDSTTLKSPKFYASSDNVIDNSLRKLIPRDAIELFSGKDIAWDPRTMRGVVLHLLGCLSENGKVR
jgi:hypothetical protein